ncbi:MAG: RusA family crossover junction endodeoxyribonuclease [Natronosporangium sp.]
MGESVLHIIVHGTPAPQGSKRHVGNGVMVESSKKVKPWREAVKYAALDALHSNQPSELPDPGTLEVDLGFLLARPKGHYRAGRLSHILRPGAPTRPATRPDIDKLARSTLDALKDAGVYRDDAQITSLIARKWYADSQPAGARIIVRSLP